MRWLNYHHLYYFWNVARLGSMTAACQALNLAQPTLSTQIKALEEALGESLFKRQGRYLSLTESGEIAFRYAQQIFELGGEMFDLLEGKGAGRADVLRVGVSDVVPKMIAYRILEPLYALDNPPRIVCTENGSESLLAELAVHKVDLVISDCPIPPSVNVLAYNHELGQSGISFLGTTALAKKAKGKFPQSLASVPLLLPSRHAAVRRELDTWLEENAISTVGASEFQDSALMKIFGKEGKGVLPIPTVVEEEVCSEFGLKVLGRIKETVQKFFLISTERKIKHPAVVCICEKARKHLFR